MPVYMIDIGNSSLGPIGAVANVHGRDPADALRVFEEAVSDEYKVEPYGNDAFERMFVYVNPPALTVAAILLSETEDCERERCEFCGDARYACHASDECTRTFASEDERDHHETFPGGCSADVEDALLPEPGAVA